MKRRIMALLLAATLVFQGVSTVPVFAAVETGEEFAAMAKNANVSVEAGEEFTLEVDVTCPEGSEITNYDWFGEDANWEMVNYDSETYTCTITAEEGMPSTIMCDVYIGEERRTAYFQINLLNIKEMGGSYTFTKPWNDVVYFEYTPETAGKYVFVGSGDAQVEAELVDANYTTIAPAESTNGGFNLECELEAETTYYVSVAGYYCVGSSITVNVEPFKFSAKAEESDVVLAYGEANTDELVVVVEKANEEAAEAYAWYKMDAEEVYQPIEGTTNTLAVKGVPSDAGTYKCVVTCDGATKEAIFTVTVSTQLNASATSGQLFYLAQGESATLSVDATGLKTPITYQWGYMDPETFEYVDVEGATGTSYVVKKDTTDAEIYYYCKVTDGLAEEQVNFTIYHVDAKYVYGNDITLPLSMVEEGAQVTYRFVPETTATYSFASSGIAYPQMLVKYADGEYMGESESIDSPWDWENTNKNLNFTFSGEFEKGKTYYLTFRMNDVTGETEGTPTDAVVKVSVAGASVADCDVTVANGNYTGAEVKPAVTVKFGNYTLVAGTDYDVTYKNNVSAGKATVVVTGKGNYAGTTSADFTINAASIAGATVIVNPTSFNYDGIAKVPAVTVKVGNVTLKAGTDYTVAVSNNTNKGTATVVVTGKGNYVGTKSATFAINAASIANATVTVATVKYTGKELKPAVTVKVGNVTLKEGVDYTVSYSNNKNIGNGKVTIAGIGNYAGSKEVTFKIAAKKGDTFKSGSYKYKITGTSTVAFAGINSTKTTTVKVADTVKIGGKTFKVTSIADKALYKKTKVKKVTIGKNVTTIGKSAFEGCKKLATVTIGAKVTKIGDKAFKNCTALKKITIPAKVTKIGKEAFYGAKNLKTITVKATKITSVGKNAFKNINKKATIKVPSKQYKKYKTLLKKGQAKTVKIKK